jgi:MOSC domain-containing protein YiiM
MPSPAREWYGQNGWLLAAATDTLRTVAHLISVNLGVPRPDPTGNPGVTGIDKRPADGPVAVRAPGPKNTGLGSGLVGDALFAHEHHGGDDQAVYAYAREDLDWWEADLGRPLTGGVFGENLTTSGLDVTGALIGERWRIGDTVVLEVAVPRIPCGTFARWMTEPRWQKRFTIKAAPGAYLRVIVPGEVRGGDEISVVHRPDHDVTIGVTFRAMTREPELLPRLGPVEELPADARALALRRTAPYPAD